jgi:hypothetical protein
MMDSSWTIIRQSHPRIHHTLTESHRGPYLMHCENPMSPLHNDPPQSYPERSCSHPSKSIEPSEFVLPDPTDTVAFSSKYGAVSSSTSALPASAAMVSRRAPLTTWNGRNSPARNKKNVHKSAAVHIETLSPLSPCLNESSVYCEVLNKDEYATESTNLSDTDNTMADELPELESALQTFLQWPSFDWKGSSDSDSPPRRQHVFVPHSEQSLLHESSLLHASPTSKPVAHSGISHNNNNNLLSPIQTSESLQSDCSFAHSNNSHSLEGETDDPLLACKVWDLDDRPVVPRRRNFKSALFPIPSSILSHRSPSVCSDDDSSEYSYGSPVRRKHVRREVSHGTLVDSPQRRPHRVAHHHNPHAMDPSTAAPFYASHVRLHSCVSSVNETLDVPPHWPTEWKRLEAENARLKKRLQHVYEDRIGPFRDVFEEVSENETISFILILYMREFSINSLLLESQDEIETCHIGIGESTSQCFSATSPNAINDGCTKGGSKSKTARRRTCGGSYARTISRKSTSCHGNRRTWLCLMFHCHKETSRCHMSRIVNPSSVCKYANSWPLQLHGQ